MAIAKFSNPIDSNFKNLESFGRVDSKNHWRDSNYPKSNRLGIDFKRSRELTLSGIL